MAEADIWPEGGIFAEDDEEGVFEDDEDVFGDEAEDEDEDEDAEEEVRPVKRSPHDNPLVTRGQEDMVSALPGTPAPAAKRQMVAVFGADGRPLVAYAVNGQVQGQFRAPSSAEIQLLQTQGRFVQRPQPAALPSAALFPGPKGAGMGEAVAAPEPPPPAPSFLQRNATLLAALTAVGVGAGVYYWQKRKQAQREEDTTDLELDADDAAEEEEA